jgi:AraC family transcriptional regulator
MSVCEAFVSDIDYRGHYLPNATQLLEGRSRGEPVAGVVFAQTSTDRVDLLERLPVGRMRRDDFAITRIVRKRPGHGLTDIGAKSESYVACVHLEQFAGCDVWRDGQREGTDPLGIGVMHINDMRHSWRADIQNPFDVVNFCIPQSTLDEVTSEDGNSRISELRCPISAARVDTVMTNLALALLPALGKSDQTNRLFVDHTARAITVHLANTYGICRFRTHCCRGGLAPWQEKRAKEMLRAKLAGDISLKELASSCRLSAGYFSRAFKQSVGCAPYQWLVHQRVELAKHLILNTDEPLCQIALTTGFVDQSHFTRVFSQRVKASPAAWRRDHLRQTPAMQLGLQSGGRAVINRKGAVSNPFFLRRQRRAARFWESSENDGKHDER